VHWLALKLARFLFYCIFGKAALDVLFAEQTIDEENQETLAVLSKCRNAGIPEKG
jgi:hypothetical protein